MTQPSHSELRALVAETAAAMRTRSIAAAHAYWEMSTTGAESAAEAAAESEKALRLFLSDSGIYARLKAALNAPTGDALLDRQVRILYRAFLENQLAPSEIAEMVERANELEQIFNNFRGVMNGEERTDNELRQVLVNSLDSAERRQAWIASKQIGPEIGPKLRELVKVRNRAAQRLGFPNFYEMQLTLSEIRSDDLFRLLDELKQLTDGPFAAMKRELDREQSSRFGIAPAEMEVWHYADPFFQEVPAAADLRLDPYFEGQSLEEIATRFYAAIGLDVKAILARADLYERAGKSQHAFCTNLDREGDVRVLCNLKPDLYWMSTLLHELGHAVYDTNIDPALPWLLRDCAHINSTEAVAMFFGRLGRDAGWLQEFVGVPPEVAAEIAGPLRREQSRAMLLLARWVMVMVGFESRLYENPDQDLNALWWQLVGELQLVRTPAALNGHEWATKLHIALAPVYYHNYLIGELTASHLQAHIARATGTERTAADPGVGNWLRERFFKPGAIYPWDRLVEEATGEPLKVRYFVEQFVR